MSKPEEKQITLTASELENIIRSAVKNALRDLDAEKDLPVNDVNERNVAPASFSLLEAIATTALWLFAVFTGVGVYVCGKIMYETGFSWIALLYLFDLGFITILAVAAAFELYRTKKLEVLNSVFSAIMAFSTLLVAIASAVFAYKAL